MSITSIEAAIVGVFQSVSGIKKVYDHEPSMLEKLPAATIVFREFEDQNGTFEALELGYGWDFRIYVPMDTNPGDSLGILKGLIDDIILAYGADVTVGGACTKSTLKSGKIAQGKDQSRAYFLVNGTIEATEYIIP